MQRIASQPSTEAPTRQASSPNPTPSSVAAANRMRSNRRVDTKPEIEVRSLLHRNGFRFRKDYPIRLTSGTIVHPDIVFTKKRVAVFIDGCYWHSCPIHGTTPKSNRNYWIPKLRQNVERDKKTGIDLRANGWKVLRIWEHVEPEDAASMIASEVLDA